MIWTWNSYYFVKVFVALFSLPQGAGSKWYSSPFKSELTLESDSMHSIIGGAKGKPYVLAKKWLIPKY